MSCQIYRLRKRTFIQFRFWPISDYAATVVYRPRPCEKANTQILRARTDLVSVFIRLAGSRKKLSSVKSPC